MAHRITEKTLDNLARILSRTLGRPEKPYINRKAQVGNIHIGNSGAYGYSIHRVGSLTGGISCLSDGMTAKEAYAWLQGALAVCYEMGIDGPIAERWDGQSVRTDGHHAIQVKYVGATDHKPSRWQAKHHERGTVYGPYVDGPIAAATKLAAKAEFTNTVPRDVVSLSPVLYAVVF
jgi:hypothetical protein